jgi:hypothetical protein
LIDLRRKCAISPEDLTDALNRNSARQSVPEVEAFCRKYTANGSFSYDEYVSTYV